MGFNEFIGKLFGNKATRDMKEIKPWVDRVKAVYPEISKLSNDELRARTEELKKYIKASAVEEQKKIEELKATIEATDIEKREPIFAQIDKLEKEVLEKYEKALDEVHPQAFAIVKDTARRFTENAEVVVTATEFDRLLAAQGKDFVRIEDDKAIWSSEAINFLASVKYWVANLRCASTKRSTNGRSCSNNWSSPFGTGPEIINGVRASSINTESTSSTMA